jgi:hypothetical protein
VRDKTSRRARRADVKVRNGFLISAFPSRSFKADSVDLIDLYQLIPRFVKRNVSFRGIGWVFVVISLLLVLTCVLPQQGQCLTAEEIAYLKKAGVTDETIQLMIQQETEDRPYSRTGVWEVEDERGNRSTLYQVLDDDEESRGKRRIEQEKVDRAWEMLKNLIIDTRDEE